MPACLWKARQESRCLHRARAAVRTKALVAGGLRLVVPPLPKGKGTASQGLLPL